MKKYLSILLVAVIVLLSGCNNKTDIKDIVLSDSVYFKKDLWGNLKLYNGKVTEKRFETLDGGTGLLTEHTVVNGIIINSVSVDDSNHKRVETFYQNKLRTKKICWYGNGNTLSETNYKKSAIIEETSFFATGIKRRYDEYVFFDPTSAKRKSIEYDRSGATYRKWSYDVDYGKKQSRLRELVEYKYGKKYSVEINNVYDDLGHSEGKNSVYFPNGGLNFESQRINSSMFSSSFFPNGSVRMYMSRGSYGSEVTEYGLNGKLILQIKNDARNQLISKEEFGKDTLGAEQCFDAIWVENNSIVFMSSYWHQSKYAIIYSGFLRKPVFIIKDSTILDFSTKGIIARVSGNVIKNGNGKEALYVFEGKFYDVNKNYNQYPAFSDTIIVKNGSDQKILFKIAGTDIYLGGTDKIAYTKCDYKMQKEDLAAFLLMQKMKKEPDE